MILYNLFTINQYFFHLCTHKIYAVLKIVREFENYTENTPKVLSLGMFDGVHFGHISIINLLKSVAQENNLETAILTFWPHPRKVFNPNDDIKLLNTLNEKLNLLENANLDVVFLKSFDENFRNLTGEEFVRQILVEKLNVKHIIIGHDHVFGKNKSGNFELLQKLSKELDFEVQQLEAVKEGNSTSVLPKLEIA
jgi:riboflavin kinase/FMN adenylyltransferase